MTKLKYIFITLPWFLLLVLVGFYIFRKDTILDFIGDPNKPLYDSIGKLHEEIVEVHIQLDNEHKKYDSLLAVDDHIEIKYHDKIKFIYSTASISDLDSIIRTALKAKQAKH